MYKTKSPSITLFISAIWSRFKDKILLFWLLVFLNHLYCIERTNTCMSTNTYYVYSTLYAFHFFHLVTFLMPYASKKISWYGIQWKIAFRIHEFWKLKQTQSDEWCQWSIWNRFKSTKHSFQPYSYGIPAFQSTPVFQIEKLPPPFRPFAKNLPFKEMGHRKSF